MNLGPAGPAHVSLRALIATAMLITLSAPGASGQASEACPGLQPGEAALVGYVRDLQLSGMPVPGAVVTVTWEAEGETHTAEGVVPDDGVYLICGVPRGVKVTLQATFSGREGPVAEVTVDQEAVRQDLSLSLSGERSPDDAPLFIGPDSRGWCPDLGVPDSMISCIRLDDCAYVRLSRVSARKVGEGSDTREMVERFVREARREEVHAVRDIRVEYEQRGGAVVPVSIEGIGIEFTEQRCINWVTNPFTIE